MSWSLKTLRGDLDAALASYDWAAAASLCHDLIRRTRDESTPCPFEDAKAILASLRRKRRFDIISAVAEAFVFSGQDAPLVRRQYAQALIDSGFLLAAEPILQALTNGSFGGDNEIEEAHGLLGRVYKQRFVNADRPDNRYARAAFERALAEYLQTYRLNPFANYWHGVNVVALLHRGRADGIPITHAPDPDTLARDILETLRNSPNNTDPFALATRAEALVSLKDFRGAEAALLDYSQHPATDSFEAASTLRQLEEVWRLRDDTPPGDTLLPILRATRLRGERGALEATGPQVAAEIKKVAKAQSSLEGNFGVEKTETLAWYKTGLERTLSIARIERLGRGKGTGWLVSASEFFPGRTGALLLTNAHVISPDGGGGLLRPDQATANFEGLGKTFALGEIAWWSPIAQLDATFVALKDEMPAASPLPVSRYTVELDIPAQRVYVIGHPDGRDIEFSLHDSKLVQCVDPFLHYRTPTEGGSSGSPVFEQSAWEVVALHHAGQPSPDKSGRQPSYEANEGIAMTALIARTKE